MEKKEGQKSRGTIPLSTYVVQEKNSNVRKAQKLQNKTDRTVQYTCLSDRIPIPQQKICMDPLEQDHEQDPDTLEQAL